MFSDLLHFWKVVHLLYMYSTLGRGSFASQRETQRVGSVRNLSANAASRSLFREQGLRE